jgi:hypothetical protein
VALNLPLNVAGVIEIILALGVMRFRKSLIPVYLVAVLLIFLW